MTHKKGRVKEFRRLPLEEKKGKECWVPRSHLLQALSSINGDVGERKGEGQRDDEVVYVRKRVIQGGFQGEYWDRGKV